MAISISLGTDIRHGTEDWNVYITVAGLTTPLNLDALSAAAQGVSYSRPAGPGSVEFIVHLPDGLDLSKDQASLVDGVLHSVLVRKRRFANHLRLSRYPE